MICRGKLNKKQTKLLLIVCFILSVVTILSVLLYRCKDNISYFGNLENYTKMSKSQKLQSILKNKNKAVVAVLAPWCGYCKKLKSSGTLTKVSKDFPVIELDDTHPESKNIMKEVGAKGYPTLCIWKNKKLYNFNGNRTVTDIKNALK